MTLSRHKLLKFNLIFHYVCYYVAWVLCLALVGNGRGWQATAVVMAITGIQVVWQYYIPQRINGLGRMVFIFMLAGFIVDSVFLRTGLIFFYENPWMPYWSPPWMISLWISFAVSFYAAMQRLWRRYFMLGLLSFFAVPFVYYAGFKLGVALLPLGAVSIFAYAVVWGPLMSLCDYVYQRSV